ncbi:MAG TPA: hypothetical protein VMO26_08780 [Vicinamibacterales bacterium]|nr:hypothetical protein [Vicinamibacterales bacterium]
MRSPALAIAWEFGRPHRLAFIALTAYLLVVGTLKLLIVGQGHLTLDPPNGLAAAALVPFAVTFFYFLAVFSYGLAGDLSARQSIYPARMLALPVTTAALTGWPMLYGATAMACLWLSTALLARWPWGLEVPWIWPALLAAAFLAWTQVLTWMPYGLPGLRVVVTVLSLAALDAAVILAIHYEASERVLVALLAPQLPLAYLAAHYAVARARRGDVPDWRGRLVWRRHAVGAVTRPSAHFRSAARAQSWFEWRRHGRSLPALVGMLLPFELALLFIPGNDTAAVVFTILLAVLLTPPVMAGFVAATVRKPNPDGRDAYGVTPFIATRPVTSAALVAAMLRVAAWSTLAAWALALGAIALALTLSGTWPPVIEEARRVMAPLGTARANALGLLGFSGLLISTWAMLVQSLYIGLSGREWIIKANGLLTLLIVLVIPPAAEWISENGAAQVALWNTWPWVLAVLAGVKMAAASWVAVRLSSNRLVSDTALVIGAACWVAVVLALYGVLVWFADTPFIPRAILALVAILAIPLARVSAAPLALAWNRHR